MLLMIHKIAMKIAHCDMKIAQTAARTTPRQCSAVGKCLVWGKPEDRLGPAEIAVGSQTGRRPYRLIEKTADGGQTISFERPRKNFWLHNELGVARAEPGF